LAFVLILLDKIQVMGDFNFHNRSEIVQINGSFLLKNIVLGLFLEAFFCSFFYCPKIKLHNLLKM
jgi:hypothetical protein